MKNDSTMPVTSTAVSPSAAENRPAPTADPTRKTASVGRRPHRSIRYAATAYPGSWASVMIRVYSNDRTSEKPDANSSEGSQMKAP